MALRYDREPTKGLTELDEGPPSWSSSAGSGDNRNSSDDDGTNEADDLVLEDMPIMAKAGSYRGGSRRRLTIQTFLSRLSRRHLFVGLAVVVSLMIMFTGIRQRTVIATTSEQNVGKSKDKETDEDMDEGPRFCTTWPVNENWEYRASSSFTGTSQRGLQLDSFAPEGGWRKPAGLRVVAMIFYGRKRNVDILDCYLRRNLASAGGYLDEVWFMAHTDKEDDVVWLRHLTKGEPGYKYVDLGNRTTDHYGHIWEYPVEDDTIYIKIDDDILYIHHDAIPQLVHTRLAQPWPFAISAQLVNGPVTAIQQYNFGAIHPFLPDQRSGPSASGRTANETWRPADMGLYPEHHKKKLKEEFKAGKDSKEAKNKLSPIDLKPTYPGHAWLLLSDTPRSSLDLLDTPIGYWNEHRSDDIAHGIGWTSWGVAAQSAYSLLHNIAQNQLSRYHWGRAIDFGKPDSASSSSSSSPTSTTFFKGKCEARPELTTSYAGPGGERLFDMQYIRYNLNFVALWGADVRSALPVGPQDEEELSQTVPRRLGRPFVIDTRAVVGHHSFFTQRDGIEATDLRDRWRALANEIACDADKPKKPFDGRCEGF